MYMLFITRKTLAPLLLCSAVSGYVQAAAVQLQETESVNVASEMGVAMLAPSAIAPHVPANSNAGKNPHALPVRPAVMQAVEPIAIGVAPTPLMLTLRPHDVRVSDALRNFAKSQGWKVSWELERDFPIDFEASFKGNFLEVVEQLATALQSSEMPVRVKAYHGNRVLRILPATQ